MTSKRKDKKKSRLRKKMSNINSFKLYIIIVQILLLFQKNPFFIEIS